MNYTSVITQQNRPNVIQNPVHRPVPLKIPLAISTHLPLSVTPPAFAPAQLPPPTFLQRNMSSFSVPHALNELQNTISMKSNSTEILTSNEFLNNQHQQTDPVAVAAAAASHFTHINALLNDYWKCIGLQALITNPTHIQSPSVASSSNLTTMSPQSSQSLPNFNATGGGIWMPQQSMPQIGVTPCRTLPSELSSLANNKTSKSNTQQKILHSSSDLSLFSTSVGGGRAAAEQPLLPSFGATAAASMPLAQTSLLPFEAYSATSLANTANSTNALINLQAATDCQSLLQLSSTTTLTAAVSAPNIAATPKSTATLLQYQENVKTNKLENNFNIDKIPAALSSTEKNISSAKSTKTENIDFRPNFQMYNTQLANADNILNTNNDQFDITSKVNIYFITKIITYKLIDYYNKLLIYYSDTLNYK